MLRVAHTLRLGAASLARGPTQSASLNLEDTSSSVHFSCERTLHAAAQAPEQLPVIRSTTKPRKSFELHIGASLPLPTRAAKAAASPSTSALLAQPLEPTTPAAAITDYFEGLPLKRWAEKLGERVMPTVELVREENKRAKAAAAQLRSRAGDLAVPVVPSFLPFTHWAANSKRMQRTLVADQPDERQKARLSWYHPDDTMVPRDWFKGGLLADLKYYRPFGGAAAATSS